MSWGRKDEEYCADFLLISKRTLTAEEHKVFTYHYLLGADWKLCCARMNIDRGQFFHCVYRIEQRLGRTFRELTPYSLFPWPNISTAPRSTQKLWQATLLKLW